MAVRPDVPGNGQTRAPSAATARSGAAVRRRNRRAEPSPGRRPALERRPVHSALAAAAGGGRGRDHRRRRAARDRLARGPRVPGPRRRHRAHPRPALAAPDRGANWLATTVLLVLVWSVLLSFVALLVLSIAQMAALLPDYAGPAEVLINGVVTDLNNAGSSPAAVRPGRADRLQPAGRGRDRAAVGLTDAASTLVLLLTALVFVAIESSGFGRRMALVAAERPHLPVALTPVHPGHPQLPAGQHRVRRHRRHRRLDRLVHHRRPGRRLWGLLAFVTNYVPNIGFVLGVVPPALLGLLAGGWSELIAVVVVYSLLNFVVQTLIQPRFVGDSVGLSMTVTFSRCSSGAGSSAPSGAARDPAHAAGKVLLVDVDPRGTGWTRVLREEPRAPRTMRAKRRMHARRAALASVRRLHLSAPEATPRTTPQTPV